MFIPFILATPIGIGIGMGVGANGGGQASLPIIVLQSLAAGTFIYLSCCNLIVDQFHNGDKDLKKAPITTIYIIRAIKMLLFFLGVAIVLICVVVEPSD